MLKKLIKILIIVVVAALFIIQFFRIDKTNSPIVASDTIEAAVPVPADVSQILGRSCNDCHSNNTIYPWYANIQPVGWFLKNHIDEAHSKLNFSVFNTYPAKKKVKKLEEICEQVESKEMPLPSYLWLHSDAVLSESDAKALCDWANQERARIVVE